MQINGKEVPAEVLAKKDPGGLLGKFERFFPKTFNKLFLGDELLSAFLFDDTIQHTISWHLGDREQKGDEHAIMLCELLNFLSPNHCKNALESGV